MAVALDDSDAPRLRVLPQEFSPDEATALALLKRLNGILPGVQCPFCSGNIYILAGDVSCMMCSRMLYVTAISPEGRILGLSRYYGSPELVRRSSSGEAARISRGGRSQKVEDWTERVLALIPAQPEYVTVDKLRKRLSLDRHAILTALDDLIADGLVVQFSYRGNYRVGYYRVRGEN